MEPIEPKVKLAKSELLERIEGTEIMKIPADAVVKHLDLQLKNRDKLVDTIGLKLKE